ncbi:MAG: hypothetical protein WBF08_07840 [Candidatus Bathyarchaeia archaeon]
MNNKKLMLILISLCALASLFYIVIAQSQTDIYVGLPPAPPTKRILYTWNVSECWSCHYIPAPMPPENVEINFSKQPSYSINAKPGLWRLTSGSGNNIAASWSPDGNKIVYTSDRFGNWTIHVIDVESRKEIQLTSPDSISGWPDWSPDGERIAFWSYRNDESQIFTIKSDGTDEEKLTSSSLLKSEPLWSPDGKIMLFGQKDEYWQIWVMNLDKGEQWQISTGEHNHWAPYWMPDGKEVLYYSSDGLVLKTVDVTGRHRRELTFALVENLPADLRPRISPDRTKILFNSLRSSNWGLWLMDIDGKNTKRLTHDGAGDRTASWSPDGKKIIYSSYRSGNPDIWIMDSDGSNQMQLIKSKFDDFSPSWSPSGGIIAYESNTGGKFDIWLLEMDNPLEVTLNFTKYPYQNSSSKVEIKFRSKVEGPFQIESVKLHFDWQPPHVYDKWSFEQPILLTSPSIQENRSIAFTIPTDAELGYHFYDLTVEFRQSIDSSYGSMRTYYHTAKDLTVASQERRIYETLHENAASEIEIQNKQAQEEGYSDILVEANQKLLLAEKLALEGKLADATEYINQVESLLQQNVPENDPTYDTFTIGVFGVLALSVIVLVYVIKRKRTL